jgi:transposase-like protein
VTHRKPYTPEQLRRIADDYAAGLTYQDIERRNECSSATVARAARLHNVAERHGKPDARAATTDRKVRTARRRLANVVPTQASKGPGWTWFDYARQCDIEFATPHYMRKAPEIKAWLEANGVKP